MKDFDIFTKIAKNVGDLGKIIVATGFEKLPKEQYLNRPIWSHCSLFILLSLLLSFRFYDEGKQSRVKNEDGNQFKIQRKKH